MASTFSDTMIVMDEEKYNVNVVSAVSVDFPGKFCFVWMIKFKYMTIQSTWVQFRLEIRPHYGHLCQGQGKGLSDNPKLPWVIIWVIIMEW